MLVEVSVGSVACFAIFMLAWLAGFFSLGYNKGFTDALKRLDHSFRHPRR